MTGIPPLAIRKLISGGRRGSRRYNGKDVQPVVQIDRNVFSAMALSALSCATEKQRILQITDTSGRMYKESNPSID